MGVRLEGLFPLTLIVVQLLFGYFVFVLGVCIFQLFLRCENDYFIVHSCDLSNTLTIFLRLFHIIPYLLAFHFLLIMFLSCYLKAMFTNPGYVTDEYRNIHTKVTIDESNPNSPTFCKKCDNIRPPRAHHC